MPDLVVAACGVALGRCDGDRDLPGAKPICSGRSPRSGAGRDDQSGAVCAEACCDGALVSIHNDDVLVANGRCTHNYVLAGVPIDDATPGYQDSAVCTDSDGRGSDGRSNGGCGDSGGNAADDGFPSSGCKRN